MAASIRKVCLRLLELDSSWDGSLAMDGLRLREPQNTKHDHGVANKFQVKKSFIEEKYRVRRK